MGTRDRFGLVRDLLNVARLVNGLSVFVGAQIGLQI